MSELSRLLERADMSFAGEMDKRSFLEKNASDLVRKFAEMNQVDLKTMSYRATQVMGNDANTNHFNLELTQEDVDYYLKFILIKKKKEEFTGLSGDNRNRPSIIQLIKDSEDLGQIKITLYPTIKVQYSSLRTGARKDVISMIKKLNLDKLEGDFVKEYIELKMEQL